MQNTTAEGRRLRDAGIAAATDATDPADVDAIDLLIARAAATDLGTHAHPIRQWQGVAR